MKFNDIVSKFLKKAGYNEQKYDNALNCPILPSHIKIVFKNSKGIKDIYNCMNIYDYIPKYKERWDSELDLHIDEISWRSAFKICFKFTEDTQYHWFQYRLINRILGTNEYLNKIKISGNDKCRLCFNNTETILHLFHSCNKTRELLDSLTVWFKRRINFDLTILPN